MSTLNINNDYIHLNSASSDKVVVEGNLGIGTSSPASQKLHVVGSTLLTGNSAYLVDQGSGSGGVGLQLKTTGANAPFVQWHDGTNILAGIRATSAKDLHLQTAGYNTRIIAKANGNVGIGTTNPETRLDIQGNGDAVQIRRSNGYASIKAHSDNGGNLILDSHSTSGAIFLNNYVNRPVYIATGGGNVGIGTTTPAAKLDVAGQIITSDSVRFTGNVSTPTGNTVFRPASNTLAFGTSSIERMRIDSSGNVGIGTDSPDVEMHISSGASRIRLTNDSNQTWQIGTNNVANGFLSIKDITDSKDVLVLTGDGNVGIGTTSPDTKLHVHKGSAGAVGSNGNAIITAENSTNGYVQILVPDANESGVLFGRPTFDADGGILYNSAVSRGLEFRTGGNVRRMVINSSGNVGIGTSSPSYKLDVNGVSRFNGATISGQIGSHPAAIVIEEDQFIFTNDGASANPRKLIGKFNDTINIGEAGTSLIAGISMLPGSSGPIRFYTGGTEYVRFDGANQRVGIGTTSPQRPLDVNGDIQNNGVLQAT
jgi:hypothetical protein